MNRRVGDQGAGVPSRPRPDHLRRRKLLVAAAPSLALAGAILVSIYVHPVLGRATAPAVLGGATYAAFSAFPRRGASAVASVVAIIAGFCLEIFVVLLLLVGIIAGGYAVLVVYVMLIVAVPVAVARRFMSRRDALPPFDAGSPIPWPQET